MDDKSQNPNVLTRQSPQQIDLPTNYKSPYLNHEKVLQPSQSFVDQMQSTNNDKPEITKPQLATAPELQKTSETLYPEATHGLDLADQQMPVFDAEQLLKPKTKGSNRTQIIVVLVILFGVYISATALLGLIGAVKLLTFGAFASGGALITIVDIVYLIIGAGIMFRRELARMAYVIVSVVGLVLSLAGGAQYFASINSVGISHLLIPIIEAYAISVIPLILITRPSVKAVFS